MGVSKATSYVMLVGCIMFRFLIAGISTGLGVMYAELIDVFKAERWEVSLIQGIIYGLAVGAGVIWAYVIEKIGIGNAMAIRLLIPSIGLLSISFVGSVAIIVVQMSWVFVDMSVSRLRKYVIFVGCLLFQFAIMGLSAGLSVMYAELIDVFEAERWEVSFIQGIFFGLAIGAGIIWTVVIEKIGIGYTMAIGLLISSIGMLSSSFVSSVAAIVVLTGVLGGIGYSTCFLGVSMVINVGFEEPELPSTILSIGSGTGQLLMPLFIELVLERYGWSGTFIMMAGMTLQCIPVAVLIEVLLNDGGTSDDEKKRFICDQQLTHCLPFWILLINLFLLCLAATPELFFIVDQIIDIGYTRDDGAMMLIATGGTNILGRITGSLIKFKCQRSPTIYHWVYLYLTLALCHLIIIAVPSYIGYLAACLIHGWSYGTLFALIPPIIYDTVGVDRYPAGTVAVNFIVGFGLLCNDVIGGIIRDCLGNYVVEYYIAICLCLIIEVGNLLICFRHSKEFEKRNKIIDSYLLNYNHNLNYETLK